MNTTESRHCSRLAKLMGARTVAIVGASTNPEKITGRPIAYMLARGFDGQLFPVNPERDTVQGLRSYPSLDAIGCPVDLAIVGTTADKVEGVLNEGIQAGVRNFVVFSSGFAEHSETGRMQQIRLAGLAARHGVAILGPNCLGVVNSATGLIASFTTALEHHRLAKGRFAFVGQSGALGAYWMDMVLRAGLGFSRWVTTGNECDIEVGAVLDHLVDDVDTEVIGIYLEGVKNAHSFRHALARAAQAGKTVIVIKAGRSKAGAAAANSHTGSLVGDDALYEACLAQYGAIRVDSLTAMIDVAKLHLRGSRIVGDRLGILSVSGGAGVMLADAAEAADLRVAPYCRATRDALEAVLPAFAKPQNPLDLTGNVLQQSAAFSRTLDVVGRDAGIDVIVMFIGLMQSISKPLVDGLLQFRRSSNMPVVVIWMGAQYDVVSTLEAAGIPVYQDIPAAIAAMAGYRRSVVLRLQAMMPPDAEPGVARAPTVKYLGEHDAKRRLAAAGLRVPANVLLDDAQAMKPASLAAAMGGLRMPVALKLQHPDLRHKSDHGAVILDLATQEAVALGVQELRKIARDLGLQDCAILIEEMQAYDFELLVGLRRDPLFGAVLTLGRGGVDVELNPDIVTRLLPLDAGRIEAMLDGLRCAALMHGYRGRRRIDVASLARSLAGLAGWFQADPLLVEVEINPLGLRGDAACVIDAAMTVAASTDAAGAAGGR